MATLRIAADWQRQLERPISRLVGDLCDEVADDARARVHTPGKTTPLRDSIETEVIDGVGRVGSNLDYAIDEELLGGDHAYLRPALYRRR